MYIEFNKWVNAKDPKFKADNHLRISNYKNIFAKGYIPSWCEEASVISLTHMNHLAEKLMLKLICLIMQQKQPSKIFRILILQVLHWNQT